jgi:sugar phosphate isomerase/epimerase
MQTLHIAIALHCFQQKFLRSLQSAAESGATGVQIDARNEIKPAEISDTGRKQLRHRLDEFRLGLASLSFPTHSALYEPKRLDSRIDAAKAAMQLAYQLNSRVVTLPAGRIPQDTESDEYSVLKNVLNDLARYGNYIGVEPAICCAHDSAETIACLLSTVTAGPIGLNFDPAVFVLAGHDPAAAFRTLYQSVTHVQVRDAVRDVGGTGVEVAVGRGEVAWDEMLALINEADYHGWLTVDRTAGDDPAGDAARAVRYLQQVGRG